MGNGTYYIGEFAKSVLGVDFDEAAVNYAMESNTGEISYTN